MSTAAPLEELVGRCKRHLVTSFLKFLLKDSRYTVKESTEGSWHEVPIHLHVAGQRATPDDVQILIEIQRLASHLLQQTEYAERQGTPFKSIFKTADPVFRLR